MLHLKESFTPKLLDEVNNNYKNKTEEANIPILRRMATYYENVGVQKNDYYKEELGLLCKLGEKERVHGFLDR